MTRAYVLINRNVVGGASWSTERFLREAWPERRRWIEEARRLGGSCGACGRGLAPGDPVWWQVVSRGPHPDIRGAWRNWRAPVCRDCRPPYLGRSPAPGEARPCAGCGRPVIPDRLRGRPGQAIRCSDRCGWTAANRRRRAASSDTLRKACAGCGGRFEATRRDAQTCSSACRQREYRRRKASAA